MFYRLRRRLARALRHDEPRMVKRCIGGSPVDSDGVCILHGETACVTTFPER